MTDVLIYDRQYGAFDEAFKLKAVAVAHARSRSLAEVAASLSIPAELLEAWKSEYADKVKVQYLEDMRVKSRHLGGRLTARKVKRADKGRFKHCPKCKATVVFEHIKNFNVRRVEDFDIGTHHSGMKSGSDGRYGSEIPYVRITTEVIQRCPACGCYFIYNIIAKLTRSEVKNY